jgi:alpha-N-acetylglucosaminidase
MFKELDYFFGKPWQISYLHAYGGNTTVHGDLAGAIWRVREITSDPRGKKCIGVGILPEIIHHNNIYYDLVTKLGWNPKEIELDAFIEDYAVRRYGKESAENMIKCLNLLVVSVYGTEDLTTPLYQRRIKESMLEPGWKPNALTLEQRRKFIPQLRKALEISLQEKKALGKSPLYEHDVVDMARQYLGELFNLHIVFLYEAYKTSNSVTFETEAKALDKILSTQEMLLSSSDYFCLQPILDKANALPGAPTMFSELIRDILTVWAGFIFDYARRDYFELVRYMYRRRVDVFVQYLRQRMKNPAEQTDEKDLIAKYASIEQDWVKKGFEVKKEDKFKGSPLNAATKILGDTEIAGLSP